MNDGTFTVGEIAIFCNLPAPFCSMNSEECEIIEPLEQRGVFDLFGGTGVHLTYLVRFRNREFAAHPQLLKKRPGKPESKEADRNTPVSWNDCAWTPELEAA